MLELQKKDVRIYLSVNDIRQTASRRKLSKDKVSNRFGKYSCMKYLKTFKSNTTYLVCVFFGLGFHVV